ncbi:sialin-like isoform X3 [Paramacrobiotus metropolitanus]|nr:sialin-like isoform X3 [Paramacrobiotus metropolitanus]
MAIFSTKIEDDAKEQQEFIRTQDAGSDGTDKERHLCIPARYQLVLFLFMGFFVMFSIRVNLNVAIVAMTNASTTTESLLLNASKVNNICPREAGNITGPSQHAGKFDWDGKTQGLILSSFFWGFILTQIPGGWFSRKFGAKYPFGLAVLLSGLFGLLMPVAATWHYSALLTLRILQGVVQGVSMPAAHHLLGLWAPPNER